MKDVALTDQIMNNLSFEVEAVPQEDEQTLSASKNPINIKIRIRKKNRKQQCLNRGVISIPKINRSMYKNEKIRLSNSDQTIMSFNVLMEREESETRPLAKQKRIFQLFKRGGCLGTQSDEDRYEYSIGTSKNVNKNDKILEPIKKISSNTLETKQFTLTKNYTNLQGVISESKQKHKDFLGKCKPGGCLDPPFGEDKYSYLPNLIDGKLSNQNDIKIKNIECECDKTIINNSDVKPKKRDRLSNSALIKKDKSESLYATDYLSTYIKDTNSIITFPSISPSTEALTKHYIHKKTKSHSSSKESKSYNVPNQLLDTYYISPKIKLTNKTSKNVSDSNPHSDTGITDAVLQNQELFLDETILETPSLNGVSDKLVNSIERNPCKNVNVLLIIDDLSNNEKNIPNFVLSNAIESDNLSISSPPVLIKPRNNIVKDPLGCTEKGLTDLSGMPEINVESSMIILKVDKEQTPNLEMNKLAEDSAQSENADTNTKYDIKLDDRRITNKFDNNAEPKLLQNDYETIFKSQDHSLYTEQLSVNYLKTENRSQRSEHSIKNMVYQTNNIDNTIATNADSEKFNVKSQNSKYINNYLKEKDLVTEVNIQEKVHLVSKVISNTSKESNVVTNYKKSIETVVATPQDLISKNKDFEIIHEAREFSRKEINQDTSEESITKENPVENIDALLDNRISNDYGLNIIHTTTPFPLKEKNEAIVETVTKSIENNIEKVAVQLQSASIHLLKVNNENSDTFIIKENVEFPSKEIDQETIKTVTKSKKSFVPENENSIETITVNKNSEQTVTKNIKKIKTENENSIETVPASPDFPTFDNKISNMINETKKFDLNEKDQVTIVTLKKSLENFIIKNNNEIDTVSTSPQCLIVKNRDSNLINVGAKVPSEETDQVSIETVKKPIASLVTKKENSMENVSASPHFLIKNSNIVNEAAELLSKEKNKLTMVNLTKSVESFVTKDKNNIETDSTSLRFLTINNEKLNLIYDAAELPSKEKDLASIATLSKSVENFIIKSNNGMKTVSALPQHQSIRVNTRDSSTINVAAELSPKNVVKTLIESLLDLTVNNEDIKIINIAESVSLNQIESTIKMNNSTEKNIASIQEYRLSNEELKLNNEVPNIHDSTKDHIIDPSNISTTSVAKSSIETMIILQKDPSFKDESKDLKITDGTEVNIRGTDQPILIISSPKNTDDVETVKSFQDSLKVTVTAQVTHMDVATNLNYKFVEHEDKSSADIFLVNESKSYKTNSINLISADESKVKKYSNTIKKFDVEYNSNLSNETKSKIQNFHMDRSNIIATDPDEEKLNKQSVSIITNNIKGVNKLHDDVKSVIRNIIDAHSSTIKQEIETPTNPKNNIFESNKTKEKRNLKAVHSTNNNGKELIHLDMAFQSFRTDKDGNCIKTLDSSSFVNTKRYQNDNILQFKTILRPNGEIKIPIDTNNDLVLYITTDRKSKYQYKQLNKTLPNVYMLPNSQHKLLSSKAADKGNLFSGIHPSTNDYKTVIKSIKSRETISESNLQQILDKVYKNKLLPLHDIIKELKDDIKELSKQQILMKDKLNKTNVVPSKPIHVTGNKCGCNEMFFRR